ncbi:WxL domain-containing protein [Enterococcus sp. AZ015]|uniref:WxL domain-containing protein n=1 Tax=Enterococcus sp. AZ015 TaxID=2774888 RepID=UPI003D2B5019
MDGLVALTGSEPEVNIKNSKIRLDQLSLIGDQARLILDASEVTISSASNRTLLLLDGSNSLLSLDNQSRLEVISTWATTVQSNGSDTVRLGNGKKQPTLSVKNESKLAITAAGSSSTNIGPDASFNNGLHIGGASAHVEILQDSLVDVTITSGRRRRAILWSGANSTVEVSNSRLNINDSLGWSEINFGTTGIPKISIAKSEVSMDGLVALTGSEPEVNIKNSKIRLDQLSLIGDQARLILDASEVTISSASNRTLLLLDGSNSLLSLDNQSRLEVISTWATTVQSNGSDTVRLGNGKKQPTLSVKNESKLAITAAGSSSTNIGPDASFNNGLHIGGASAHVEILQDSLVDVTITSGRRRRAILWSGANSTVEVSNSRLNINDSLGWSEINFGTTGIPKISIAKSEVSMDGLVALTGSEPEVNIKNSKIRLDQLSLIGDQARLILDASEVTISSASNRTLLLLDGSNSLLSLDNQSRLEVISTWATTVQSNGSDTVRLGNGKKQPTLSVKNESKLAITAAGSSSTNIRPDASFNNGLHIGGASAHVEILQDSLVDVTITSGRRRRAIWLNGNSPVLNIKGGSLVMNSPFQGMTLGANATINVLESSSFIAQASQSGVVNGDVMNIVFDDALLIDIQHRSRGNIFDAAVGSTLISKNNNLSLWEKSSNLNNDPQRVWDSFDYALSGRDFNVITEANNTDFNNNVESFGEGLSLYSRMKSEGDGQKNDSLVPPVDPLLPENEIDPENPPILPENQGLLSIDFVSQFQFGISIISAQDHTYYAQAQRLLDADGTVNGTEQRPNYIQISDRRPENERNGWQLAVTQKEQFKGDENQELLGASLSLSNQQIITAQGRTKPILQSDPCTLIPGKRRTLLIAQGNEGAGTWIHRFGDSVTKGESVALNVPKGANPEATKYSTTLIWELSAVPEN